MKIENLDLLVNLTWLDLSFNQIKVVEGLTNLHNLTDLSLFNNQISELGNGLSNCRKLNILSIGRNNIAVLKTVSNSFNSIFFFFTFSLSKS